MGKKKNLWYVVIEEDGTSSCHLTAEAAKDQVRTLIDEEVDPYSIQVIVGTELNVRVKTITTISLVPNKEG